MARGSFPDHYATLNIPQDADREAIREAYKRAALANHPDRAVDDEDRKARTLRFQQINEAHYVLSDDRRRREYDEARRMHARTAPDFHYQRTDGERQFADIFEEAFRNDPDVSGLQQNGWFYKVTGSVAGAVLGFILANIPGAIGGFVAGNRLGAIRDNHGKSVYEVYQGLDPEMRNHILTQLAAKVLSGAFAS